ncbi:MAG: DUF3275 family protein [gamma proteobacterium symbiont of Bathyaustriella thionipta]|nr:DUF3275 family protein [gamma proteobacterium symbiont of Bathyaustriella thionipta]MCU7950955.1 DUF3275 family protein [gamma proteobacterium symbiont of Bathyaustriella thionipta]MCU7954533.1 DUF3275 family protein [gamma proteobacterium symbiont of Bathyaustriella thionipta]MCU7957452.1 DUF3275 family protein [gamma proteobacterium symbiont of Bathyaustriella thionipta]MCU7966432.1 DUF3275 family protein [gamma proteobacterium symbiont of Bathyaustriella thionipta]
MTRRSAPVENIPPIVPDTNKQKPKSVTKSKTVKPQKAKQSSEKAESSVNMTIFGHTKVTNQPGDEVKLDPTNRQQLRQQRDALLELGYKFDARRQIWVK